MFVLLHSSHLDFVPPPTQPLTQLVRLIVLNFSDNHILRLYFIYACAFSFVPFLMGAIGILLSGDSML